MADRAIDPAARALVPSGPGYRMFIKSTPVLLGAVASLVVVRNGLVGVVSAAVVALTLAGVGQFLRRERVVVTPEEIRVVRPAARERVRRRSEVALVVSVRVTAPSGARSFRNLLVLDDRERLIVRLKSPHWTPDDMRRLVRWLGSGAEELDRPVSARQLGRRFPRAVPWSERYPFVSGVAVMAVMAAVIAGASVALG